MRLAILSLFAVAAFSSSLAYGESSYKCFGTDGSLISEQLYPCDKGQKQVSSKYESAHDSAGATKQVTQQGNGSSSYSSSNSGVSANGNVPPTRNAPTFTPQPLRPAASGTQVGQNQSNRVGSTNAARAVVTSNGIANPTGQTYYNQSPEKARQAIQGALNQPGQHPSPITRNSNTTGKVNSNASSTIPMVQTYYNLSPEQANRAMQDAVNQPGQRLSYATRDSNNTVKVYSNTSPTSPTVRTYYNQSPKQARQVANDALNQPGQRPSWVATDSNNTVKVYTPPLLPRKK